MALLASAFFMLPMPRASAASKHRVHKVAVLPAIGDGVPAAALDAVDVALESLALLVPGVEPVFDEELRGVFGRDPRAALVECGVSLECLVAAGRKADTAEILFARLSATAVGFELKLSVFGVGDGSLRRSLVVQLAKAGSVEAALAGHERTLFGGSEQSPASSATDHGASSTGDVWQGGALGSSTPLPKEHTGDVTSKAVETVATPIAVPPIESMPAVAAVQTSVVQPSPSEAPSEPVRPLFLAGVGATVVAIAGAGVGGVFAARYREARATIDPDGSKSTSQPEAVRLAGRANEARSRAITGLTVGTVAALAAAGMFVWARVDRAPVQVTLEPAPRGASLRLEW
jgi:hypothetical protein